MKAAHSPEEDSGPVSVGLLGRSRSNDIETLRAVALILMVVGHVIGNTEDTGMRVAAGSAWRHFYDTLSPFRMPLFTAISGYVYAVRPVVAGGAIEFFRGRIPRLLLPLVSVQPLFLLIQKFTHGAHGSEEGESLLSFLLQPHAHFWFLYAMTWIALATPALELSFALRTPFRWSLVLLAACLAKMLVSAPNVLGLDHGFFLLPYFVLGVGLRRFGESALRSPTNKLRVGGLVAICVVLHQLQLLGILNLTPRALDFTVLIFGLLSATLAIGCRGPIPGFGKLATYAFGIYLFHIFGTAGARMVLHKLGIHNMYLVFTCSLAAGMCFPVALERISDQNAWARFILFGRTKPLPAAIRGRTTNHAGLVIRPSAMAVRINTWLTAHGLTTREPSAIR